MNYKIELIMKKEILSDMLILEQDRTALYLIKKMRALSYRLYKKIDDRNQVVRYQHPKYEDFWIELDPILFRIECMIDDEIDYMKQQIEKKKRETNKSDFKVVENRYDSTLNHKKKIRR